jgi:hypothetical protein
MNFILLLMRLMPRIALLTLPCHSQTSQVAWRVSTPSGQPTLPSPPTSSPSGCQTRCSRRFGRSFTPVPLRLLLPPLPRWMKNSPPLPPSLPLPLMTMRTRRRWRIANQLMPLRSCNNPVLPLPEGSRSFWIIQIPTTALPRHTIADSHHDGPRVKRRIEENSYLGKSLGGLLKTNPLECA